MHDDSIDIRSYLMGIFDGEGCISGGKDRRDGRWFLMASVCMASESVVHLFQQTWGGGFHIRSKRTVGGLVLYQWLLAGGRAVAFLEFAAAHSLVKRRQAEVGLQLARNMMKYSDRGYRRGVRLSKGERIITPEDHAVRECVVRELRGLNGGRSRFSDQPSEVSEHDLRPKPQLPLL